MKIIICRHCLAENQHYSFKCYQRPNKPVQELKKKKPIVSVYKPTKELPLFLNIYAERNGICEITGEQLQFDVSCFAHILSKGAYPSLRLFKENICFCNKEIHQLYDNSSKEKLLEKYPKAISIYERKEILRLNYYNTKKESS